MAPSAVDRADERASERGAALLCKHGVHWGAVPLGTAHTLGAPALPLVVCRQLKDFLREAGQVIFAANNKDGTG